MYAQGEIQKAVNNIDFGDTVGLGTGSILRAFKWRGDLELCEILLERWIGSDNIGACHESLPP